VLDRIKYVREKEIPFLSWLGQNSLFFFALGGILYAVVSAIIGKSAGYQQVHDGTAWDLIIGLAIYFAVLFGVSYVFHKKKIKIHI